MINYIRSKIFNNEDSTTTKSTSTESTIKPTPSSTSNPSNSKCANGNGYYGDKESGCKKFYVCKDLQNGNYDITIFDCPSHLLFDEKIKSCNYPSQVSC